MSTRLHLLGLAILSLCTSLACSSQAPTPVRDSDSAPPAGAESRREEAGPSARSGLEIVLALLEQHGLSSGRVQLLEVRCVRDGADSRGPNAVRVSVDAIFRADDELEAARAYEQFLESTRELPTAIDVQPASTRRASDDRGLWMRDLVATLELPREPQAAPVREFDYALRATALDYVGSIDLRFDSDESTGPGARGRSARRVRPLETPPGSGFQPGFELSTLREFLRDLEHGPAGARVRAVHLSRVRTTGRDSSLPDLFSFEVTVSP